MLYNRCTGIYKFGNNTYLRRIRRRSNLGHIFREKGASYGPGNTVLLSKEEESRMFYTQECTRRQRLSNSLDPNGHSAAAITSNIMFVALLYSCLILGSRDSSVSIATRYGLDGLGIESLWGARYSAHSRPALEPTQAPIPGYSRW